MSLEGHFRPSSAGFAYRPLPLSPKSGHSASARLMSTRPNIMPLRSERRHDQAEHLAVLRLITSSSHSRLCCDCRMLRPNWDCRRYSVGTWPRSGKAPSRDRMWLGAPRPIRSSGIRLAARCERSRELYFWPRGFVSQGKAPSPRAEMPGAPTASPKLPWSDR
jgi:hypothetical protein